MAVSNSQIDTSTTRVAIATAVRDSLVSLLGAGGSIFVGNSSVTPANGFLVGSSTVPVTVRLAGGDVLYAVSSQNSTIFVLMTDINIVDAALTDTELRASSVPISGTVAVSDFPATQPVSIATMPSTPVTGTFWQAVQPVTSASVSLSPASPANITIGTTSTQLVAANTNRKGLIIGVAGTGNIVSLGLGVAAIANKGIVLKNAGLDVWKMDQYSFYTGAVNGVANGANTVVVIQEFS